MAASVSRGGGGCPATPKAAVSVERSDGASDGVPLIIGLRGKSGVSFSAHIPGAGVHGRHIADVEDCLEFLFSPDGSVLAAVRKDRVSLLSASDMSLRSEIVEENVVALSFSPLSTKLITLRKRNGLADVARESDAASSTRVCAEVRGRRTRSRRDRCWVSARREDSRKKCGKESRFSH